MKQLSLFNGQLNMSISNMIWNYLCQFRFFSDNPSIDEVETEFISGTGITEKKVHLWNEAEMRFTSYVKELQEIYGQEDYFMKLRNLIIEGGEVEQLADIIDGIDELSRVINDNYDMLKEREIGIEFNIGSRLGETREYLVVYSNPALKDKLYVFVLKKDEQKLVTKTTFSTFQCMADKDERKVVNKVIATGFKRLPQFAFLSIEQMKEAKKLAESIA